MNIFKKAVDALRNSVNRTLLNTALFQWWISDGTANIISDTAVEYLKQGYSGNVDVYSIINRIDLMRRQATLTLRKKNPDGTSEEVTDHELLKFKKKVNPFMNTDDYITGFLTYWLSIGENFTYTLKLDSGVNAGKAQELHLLPASCVDIIEGTILDPIRGYKIDDSYNQEFAFEEVVHTKMFNPLWLEDRSLHGQSPLKAAARIVSKQNQAEDTELKQFENQGPKHILYRDVSGSAQDGFSTPQQQQVEKDIKNQGSGKKRGLPYVAKNKMGKLDLGSTVADLNVIESSKDGRRILGNVYAFPMDLMNDPSGSTYNSKREARKSAWTDCIMPNLAKVETTLNEATIENIEEYKDLFWAFDYSEVEELQEGFKDRVDWMNKAYWTPNEIRQATGKKKFDSDFMDEPKFSMQDIPLSQMGETLSDENKSFEDYINAKD